MSLYTEICFIFYFLVNYESKLQNLYFVNRIRHLYKIKAEPIEPVNLFFYVVIF